MGELSFVFDGLVQVLATFMILTVIIVVGIVMMALWGKHES